MLDDRKSIVLGVLIEEYIRHGEPVSSSAVLERSGLGVSSATIRNDLAALERDGFVSQPHTSAGRIPTSKGYRHYVDHVEPARLRAATRVRIQDFFSTVHVELGRLLKATSDLVADVAHYPAVVLGPGLAGDRIRGCHVVQMGERSALVVLVTDRGNVSQELVALPDVAGPEDVAAAERALVDLLVEHSVTEAAGKLPAVLEEISGPVATVLEAAFEAALRTTESTRSLYVGGTSQMAGVWEDLGAVHRVLEVLEREAMLLSVLASAEPGTLIRIGEELPPGWGGDLAVVSSSYDVGGEPAGTIGVLGPMRMDYRRTVKIVEEVRDGLADRLGS